MPKQATESATLNRKKLGIMVAAGPGRKNFLHAIQTAEAGARQGAEVYLYFIDEAVLGLGLPEVRALGKKGIRVFGCAFSLQKRRLPLDTEATMVGLTMLNEIMTGSDRFLSFT